MALPNQKRSVSRQKRRKYQFRLSKQSLQRCAHCKKMIMSHKVCAHCGYYNGKEIIKIKEKGRK
ncbi:MAG: 50S ribosomal protein L32 [Parcubacteria group bacterium]|nr:50S ribosomal protein L32 [Parcubacteria group bacterium]